MSIPVIDVEQLSAVLATGARLVDVRETSEYEAGHVPGAVHVALSTVPEHIDTFRGEGPAYVICQAGGRSQRACEFLAQHGLDVVNIAGGTGAWINSGRAVVTGSNPE
jgi:rhodanese-related sulfurtransferase